MSNNIHPHLNTEAGGIPLPLITPDTKDVKMANASTHSLGFSPIGKRFLLTSYYV